MIISGSLSQALKPSIILFFVGSSQQWLVIIVQCLTGLGFALLITGSVNLIDTQAHPDLLSTYQSLFTMSSTLATVFGSLFASFIVKTLNSSYLMGLDAVVILMAVVYFLVFVRRSRPRQHSFTLTY